MENGITIKNRFTIKSGDELATAHNSLVSLSELLTSSSDGYAKFIRVGNAENEVDGGGVSAKECTLCEYNFDLKRGSAYAAFSATFTDDDLDEGVEITQAGLSYDRTGAIVNKSQFVAVTKKAEKEICVRVELILELKSQFMQFVAGENLLVKALLGVIGLDLTVFEIASGDNYHKDAVIKRGDGLIAQRKNATVTFNGQSIIVKANLTVTLCELILFYKNQAVLRGIFAPDAISKNYAYIVGKNLAVETPREHINNIYNLRINNSQATSFDIFDKCVAITDDCTELFEQNIPREALLIGEPTGNFFGVLTEKELQVYKVENDKAVELYKTPRESELVQLCSDGSAIMAGGGTILVKPENGLAKITKLPFSGVTQVAITVEDGLYHLALLLKDMTFIRFSFNDETEEIIVLEQVSEVGEDFVLSRNDARYINFWSYESDLYSSVRLLGEHVARTDFLSRIGSSTSRLVEMKGKWFKRYNATARRYFIGSLDGADTVVNAGGDFEIIDCNDLAFITVDGEVQEVISYDGTEEAIASVSASVDFGDIVTIVKAGNYLLLQQASGKVSTLYPVTKGKVIYFYDEADEGDIATFDALVIVDPIENASSLDVKLTLKVGD